MDQELALPDRTRRGASMITLPAAARGLVELPSRHGLGDALEVPRTPGATKAAHAGLIAPAWAIHTPDRSVSSRRDEARVDVVALRGEWDIASIDVLRRVLNVAIADTSPMVVVDLTQVTFADLHVAVCLKRAAEKLFGSGRQLKLTGAKPAVRCAIEFAAAGHLLTDDVPGDGDRRLTARQHEVLRLLDEGLSTKQIAGRLWLSPATVRNHVSAILRALDAHTRLEALRRGRDTGLLQ